MIPVYLHAVFRRLRALALLITIPLFLPACAPPARVHNGDWLRTHHEQVRRDCQPILDDLADHFTRHGRYPSEADPVFTKHAEWLNARDWNWTYYTEPDKSAFCLGIGDRDMDGISVVFCSRHEGWALDTKNDGLVDLKAKSP